MHLDCLYVSMVVSKNVLLNTHDIFLPDPGITKLGRYVRQVFRPAAKIRKQLLRLKVNG